MEPAHVAEFPKFLDGDTKLVISPVQSYQLHSDVLRRNSPFFAYLLDGEGPADLCSAAKKNGITIRYHFELVRPHGPERDVGTFERKSLDKYGRPTSPTFGLPELDNGKIANEQNQYWDWLFGVFYHITPRLNDENLATTLSGCMGLVDVAESVHAVDNVRPTVDLSLLRHNNVLWTSVAANPIAWAELGRRVHSPTIFREGIVHIIGKWNNISDAERVELHPDIRTLCQRKYDEINLAKEAIEMRILGHYPDFLCRNAIDRPGRPTYSNDIYMWMAICFFRHWFAQAISDGRNRLGPDAGYEFYHQIGAAGQAYLNHESFKNFHQYFPMSAKACNVLEANMNVMKEDVKKFVQEILVNRTTVDPRTFPLKWLTCAQINKQDLPWHVEEEDEFALPSKDGILEDIESVPTAPLRPPGKKRKRQSDRHGNSFSNTLGAPAGFPINDDDLFGDNED